MFVLCIDEEKLPRPTSVSNNQTTRLTELDKQISNTASVEERTGERKWHRFPKICIPVVIIARRSRILSDSSSEVLAADMERCYIITLRFVVSANEMHISDGNDLPIVFGEEEREHFKASK